MALALATTLAGSLVACAGIPIRPDPVDFNHEIATENLKKELTIYAVKHSSGYFSTLAFRYWYYDKDGNFVQMSHTHVLRPTDGKWYVAEDNQYVHDGLGNPFYRYHSDVLYKIDVSDPSNNQLLIKSGNQIIHIDDKHPDAEFADTDDPINTIAGNMVLNELDVFIPAPGLPLEFRRFYNSGFDLPGSELGSRWSHTFDWMLTETSTTFVAQNANIVLESVYVSAIGRTFDLPQSSSNVWHGIGSDDRQWVVTQLNDGRYSLKRPGAVCYQFDTNGIIEAVSDPWDNSLTFTHSGDYPTQQLTRVEHSNGQFLSFSYEGDRISKLVTPDANLFVTYSYDSHGQLTNTTRNTSGGAQATTFCYAPAGMGIITQRINALGHAFAYSYATNDSGQATSRAISMVLESNLFEHAASYQTNNHISTVAYERNGTNQTYTYHYDNDSKRITRILGPNSTNLVTTITRDPYTFDLTAQRVSDYSVNEWTETARTYDLQHNIISEASGFSSTPSETWNFERHEDFDTVTRITDPEGNEVQSEYTNGLLATLNIIDGATTHDTGYTYDTQGRLTRVLNANGNSVRFQYDSFGFPTSTIPDIGPVTFTRYSQLGHLEQLSLPGDTGRRMTSFFPDELGRVTNIVYPNGLTESFEYDALGNLTNHVDTAGRSTFYSYDPTRKLKSVTRILDGATPTNITTGFDYDQQFNTLSIVDERGRQVEAYSLDIQDRPVEVTNVEGQTMSIEYGVADFVRRVTRFDGSVTSNQYDSSGRLAEVYYPDQTNRFTYLKNGLVRSSHNSLGTISNTYCPANRLTATYATAPNSVVTYTYLGAGQVSNMSSVAGITSYEYDAADRIRTLETPSGAFTYTYNANNGLVSSMTTSTNGISANYKYDVLDRLISIEWLNTSTQVLKRFKYDYDSAGMITNVGREAGERIAYVCDSLDRLTGEVHRDSASTMVSSESYTYDQVGNRLAKSHDDLSLGYQHNYGSNGNRLEGWS